jgi:YVTN family beta-propeller protein
VALTPDDQEAYVTNAADGTVSVIHLGAHKLTHTIDVGNEPRGIAITPNGAYAFVALHTEGKVAVISTRSKQVINTAQTGGNPQAIAITNNGDENDDDERVFSTLFFSRLIDPQRRPDGFDDAKEGVVKSFTVGDNLAGGVTVAEHVLEPLAESGFVGDRRPFCLRTRQILQSQGKVFFNSGPDGTGDGASQLANEVFCPDPNSNDASDTGPIANTPQGVYPNALHAALIRGNDLFLPNEGAAPEPPLQFRVNVQYLVGVIDITTGQETNRTVNVNAQILIRS